MTSRIGALAIVLFAAACAREPVSEVVQQEPTPPVITAPGSPDDLAEKVVETTIPIGGPERVTSIRVGPPGGEEKASYAAGSPITATLETEPLPAGSVVRMVLRKGDLAVETQKGADENARRVVITTDETRTMEPGTWTLEIWLGGDKVDERPIEVTKGVQGG